jgi:hypothetical protein
METEPTDRAKVCKSITFNLILSLGIVIISGTSAKRLTDVKEFAKCLLKLIMNESHF